MNPWLAFGIGFVVGPIVVGAALYVGVPLYLFWRGESWIG